MFHFNKNDFIGGYKVIFSIREGNYAETYRVEDFAQQIFFLKLIDCSKLELYQISSNILLEKDITCNLAHSNLSRLRFSGDMSLNGKPYVYLVYDFISGETLQEKLVRDTALSVYEAKRIIIQILEGLDYLHSQATPIAFNDLTPANIMLDVSVSPLRAVLIDFGHAQYVKSSSLYFNANKLNVDYSSKEIRKGQLCIQNDLFSAGVILYQMIFGQLPEAVESSVTESQRGVDYSLFHPLIFPDKAIFEFSVALQKTILNALNPDPSTRFQSARAFINALKAPDDSNSGEIVSNNKNSSDQHGFAAIAGMELLKSQLQNDVINMLENPEEYKKHCLTLPNGILLYGPPGCGKTFFAKKFAEETGYNFQTVVTSDIASIYVHGTQEKIRSVFDAAKKKAPTILYFDEINSMVPKRDSSGALGNGVAGEVNEFLSQLDNIGSENVFVVASTNYPHLIDPAVLRAGRLEQKFYIPPPDMPSRQALFELYLTQRPIDDGLDYARLAELTEHFVSADIKFIVDKASRYTIQNALQIITMQTLEFIVKTTKPTVSKVELQRYEAISF